MASDATRGQAQAHGRVNTRSRGRPTVDGSFEDLITLDIDNPSNASVSSSNDEIPASVEVQEKRGRQLSLKARENEATKAGKDAEAAMRRRRTSVSTGPVSTKEFNMLYDLVSKVFDELVNVGKEIDTVRSELTTVRSELKAVSGELKTAQSTTEHVRDKVNDLEGRFNDVIQQVGTVQKGVNSISTTTASYASKVSSGLALPTSAATTPSSALTGMRSVATGASASTLAKRKLLHLSLKNVKDGISSVVNLTDHTTLRTRIHESWDQNPRTAGIRMNLLQISNDLVKIGLSAEDEARVRNSPEWISSHFEGATIKEPQWYPVKIDRVPKSISMDAQKPQELRGNINTIFGAENNVKVMQMRNMGAWRDTAKFHSMVVFLASEEDKDKIMTATEVTLGGHTVFAREYVRVKTPSRCWNCQSFGHRSDRCTKKAKCVRCGSVDHHGKDCQSAQPHCANCGEGHEASDPVCRTYVKEKRGLQAQVQ